MTNTDCPVCNRGFDTYQGMRIHQAEAGHMTDSNARIDTESHIERYKRIREEIPDKYRDAYEEITGQGKPPRGFQAAVCYIESDVSQYTVEEAFDVTPVTIRDHTRRLINRGVVSLEYVQTNSPRAGTKGQFNGDGEMCAGEEIKNGL